METDGKNISPVENSESSEEKAKENQVEDGELHEDGHNSNKGEEEDVPDDFFDDFSNQDFMDGLDIVDAWDETVKNKKLQEQDKEDKQSKNKKNSREGKSRSAERDKRKRSLERRKRSREKRHKENSPCRKRPVEEREIRRDPSKTKRDIEKDRENYVKKKEQKLISQVIETGLVPPGMETEVNLSELEDKSKESKGKEKQKLKRDSFELEAHKSKKHFEREEHSRDRKRRSRSFGRVSPMYRGRSKDRSYERSKGRREMSRERSRRSRERSSNRVRLLSPFSPSPNRRRRNRSISDRERWLKSRRSISPERKYRDRMGDEKISFLEEIKMKLDGLPNNHSQTEYNFPSNSNFRQHGPSSNFPIQQVQHPMPTANQYFPPNPHSPYDQNFFIGDSQHLTINHSSMNVTSQVFGAPTPVLPPSHQLAMSSSVDFGGGIQQNRQPLGPVPPPSTAHVSPISNVVKLMEQIKASTSLMKQKKMQLRPSAFSSNPEALQKKVNVLSRCQDILKELTGDKKFGGKLIVMNTNKKQAELQVKNISPLLRKQPVRFSFSTPSKTAEKSTFQSNLNKALIKAGVISEVIDLDSDENPALPLPKIGKKKNAAFGSKNVESSVKNVLMKMCQTDPMTCEDCEKRKGIQYRSIGIQCGESDRYNVGVQVCEMDLVSSKISKNQSLAYLTPAQLLGRGEATSTKVDPFSNHYGQSSKPYRDYGDWPRSYPESDERGMDYGNSQYPGSAMRDSHRFPRY
ncbi:hypothetical protein WA026_012291 [Henosepilachna vigintioctopunctata]|uniref:Uncharacterized protein n=1 Tax=Henosepilachna vigintioctopunctata TaxID=420089 RepID=A0AAW1UWP0_9CUCU